MGSATSYCLLVCRQCAALARGHPPRQITRSAGIGSPHSGEAGALRLPQEEGCWRSAQSSLAIVAAVGGSTVYRQRQAVRLPGSRTPRAPGPTTRCGTRPASGRFPRSSCWSTPTAGRPVADAQRAARSCGASRRSQRVRHPRRRSGARLDRWPRGPGPRLHLVRRRRHLPGRHGRQGPVLRRSRGQGRGQRRSPSTSSPRPRRTTCSGSSCSLCPLLLLLSFLVFRGLVAAAAARGGRSALDPHHPAAAQRPHHGGRHRHVRDQHRHGTGPRARDRLQPVPGHPLQGGARASEARSRPRWPRPLRQSAG